MQPSTADRLRYQLGRLGVSQAELRRRLKDKGLKVTESAVSQWVLGRTEPKPKNLRLILEVLGLTEAAFYRPFPENRTAAAV